MSKFARGWSFQAPEDRWILERTAIFCSTFYVNFMASFTQSKSSCMLFRKTLSFFRCLEKAGSTTSRNSAKPARLCLAINDLNSKSHQRAESVLSSSAFLLKTVLEAEAPFSSCFGRKQPTVHWLRSFWKGRGMIFTKDSRPATELLAGGSHFISPICWGFSIVFETGSCFWAWWPLETG